MSPTAPKEDSEGLSSLAQQLRAATPRGAKLGKEQKQFNKLVKDIDALRTAIAQWQEYEPRFRQRVASEIEPLMARYRASRMELVMIFKSAIDGHELGKRQQAKAREILCWHVAELLEEGPDEALTALYEQYAEPRRLAADGLLERATEILGEESDQDLGTESFNEDDIARFIDERLAEERAWHAERSGTAHEKSARAQAQAARHEKIAENANQAVRQIYRKLASELHPDRETDAAERTRKTALMQQANQAYAASDLLTLLGLQLQVEQLDPSSLAGLARERLQQYNHLLDEQRQKLRYELADLSAVCGGTMSDDMHPMSPAAVERALDREARDIKRAAKACESDVAHLRKMTNIKDALDDYRLGDVAQRGF